jgi:hypothetical protein
MWRVCKERLGDKTVAFSFLQVKSFAIDEITCPNLLSMHFFLGAKLVVIFTNVCPKLR